MMMMIDNEDTFSDPTCFQKQHCVGWLVEMDDSNGLVSSFHPLASAMHRPATRGSPRQPRPGPPGAQTRRRATQGAAGCHRQRHGEAYFKRRVFFPVGHHFAMLQTL